jgi:hypothetical protein
MYHAKISLEELGNLSRRKWLEGNSRKERRTTGSSRLKIFGFDDPDFSLDLLNVFPS